MYRVPVSIGAVGVLAPTLFKVVGVSTHTFLAILPLLHFEKEKMSVKKFYIYLGKSSQAPILSNSQRGPCILILYYFLYFPLLIYVTKMIKVVWHVLTGQNMHLEQVTSRPRP